MKVEIWSDVVCPWCYVGKRRFEAALAAFPHRDDVEVRWRSFELDPQAPAEKVGDYAELLSAKYGFGVEQGRQMIATMTDTAAADGLSFRFDRARVGNTFDAHRLLHLAAERGVQDAVKERFMLATFTQGAPIGEHATLVRLAAEAGLDAAEAGAVLALDRYAAEVRADQAQARAYGITGVPFFVVDGAYGVSGAQSTEVLLDVLAQAHSAARPLQQSGQHAPGCDGDACAV